MNEIELHEEFERLKEEIIEAITPPWWERWLLLGSFFSGVLVGYFLGQWFVP